MIIKNAMVFRNNVFKTEDYFINVPDTARVSFDNSSDNIYVFPAFCDVHVHFREPGFSYKETISSGSRAAARGGYSDVCTMPNLNPVPDCCDAIMEQRKIIERDAAVNVHPYASVTVGEKGEKLSDFDALSPLCIAFSDDGRGVQSEDMMRTAMTKAKSLGMIGPHWSKGWIIEDCEISNSKCAGISLGKYYDPENDHYFTNKYVKSPTQMERDAVCRGQYHGWLKEKVGSHIIRRNNIHHCEQGGIIGRMGGVFSIIEDNHIHHINNMMELGGAEIAGIKMHAAIDVIMRRNHIHHCTMGIWCDWEAQGTRLSQNLLHDNQRPAFAKQLKGGMMCQDIFVEVGHGPTLIDNNILLSDASLRFATQGVAMVHNLICGALTCVGEGTSWRYTPYHMPHRTEVMGFMTILHGDDRFYNNIFVQKWPSEDFITMHDSDDGFDSENRKVGTWMFDEYPTYDEWISQFDFTKPADMKKLESVHFDHLPVWSEGNVYLNGAKAWKHEKNGFVSSENVKVELTEKDGKYFLDTNIYEILEDFSGRMINTEVLGKAFEPEEFFENPDGTPITFDTDYFGGHRGAKVIPGPFAEKEDVGKNVNICTAF